MIYAVIGLVVVLVGVGVFAAVWIGRLKDESNALSGQLSTQEALYTAAQTNLKTEQARRAAAEERVDAYEKAYRELELLASSGVLDTPVGVVSELRKLFESGSGH